MRKPWTQRYYHHDQLGSTRALTAANGTVVARSDYDPYGNPTTTPAASNPFGYAGQYTDHATGLIYMRARWYDPATGQFITSDPIGHASGETNLYRYAAGDPANLTDRTGLLSISDIAGAALDIVSPIDGAVSGAIGEIGDAVGITDLAEDALAYWAEAAIDECASSIGRGVANVAGALSALATKNNIGDTTLTLANAVGWTRGIEIGTRHHRVAPWGNRAKRYPVHPTGRFPHYHWQRLRPNGKVKPGGSYERHRPWDKNHMDNSWKDRF